MSAPNCSISVRVTAGGRLQPGAEIATSTALWVALPLAFGVIRTIRREVQ